jgi:signal recognition particle receptor subunit beta
VAAPAVTGATARRRQAKKGAKPVKIVVTGPFGAGKTTLISTISEIEVLATEKKITDGTKSFKPQTTVAMDFGRLTIDEDLVLYLFGTPGQKRFDFMWDILAEGMLGFIVLVDDERPDTLGQSLEILKFFRKRGGVPYVVGVNKVGQSPGEAAGRTRARLRVPRDVRVVEFDARDRESVKHLLLELLYATLEDVEGAEAAG